MKKEYLLPFIRASEEISKQYFNVDVKSSNVSIEKTIALDSDILIIVGIRGGLSGIVLLGIDKKEAIDLATHVLEGQGMGQMGGEWNEITRSVLLEYGNQVVGYVTNLYAQRGYLCDITTPSFIKREQIAGLKKESVRFEMENSYAKMNVKLHIQEN